MNIKRVARRAMAFLPDKQYIQLQYLFYTNRRLDLKHPIRFNEKLQWMKLYDHNPRYTELVDKYKVKKVVAEAIGSEYVIPLLAVWDRAEDIDITDLPDRFVLKTNHDSKGVRICTNKEVFDLSEAKHFLGERLKHSGYAYGREWPYKNIERKVIAEVYLEDATGGLVDYKVMCFNGKARLIQVHQGRFTDDYTMDIYDTAWNKQPFNQKREKPSSIVLDKPSVLDDMICLSEKLAEGIPQVRIDWYYVNQRLYFGEITFFDGSGYYDFVPDEMNEIIGSWIRLPIE